MLKTILCATDFSEYSRFAVDWSVWLSNRFNARLVLFHAVPARQDSLFASEVISDDAPSGADADTIRDRLARLGGKVQAGWEPIVARGDSVEELLPVVRSRRIDLVVVASYGLTGLRRVLLGTVVERMARSLNCPLWVARADASHLPEAGLRRIAVACDFSISSQMALEATAGFAASFGAEIRLIHSLETPVDESVVEPTAGPYEEVQALLLDRLRRRLEQMPAQAGRSVPPIRAEVLQGVPGEQVPLYAQHNQVDLIAVGVRRQGPVQKYLRGSTTESILRHAPCPVLAIPEGASIDRWRT